MPMHVSGDNGSYHRMAWRKSSRSWGNGNCVEAAQLPEGQVGVRDSKNPRGGVIRFSPSGWNSFLAGLQGGKVSGQG